MTVITVTVTTIAYVKIDVRYPQNQVLDPTQIESQRSQRVRLVRVSRFIVNAPYISVIMLLSFLPFNIISPIHRMSLSPSLPQCSGIDSCS